MALMGKKREGLRNKSFINSQGSEEMRSTLSNYRGLYAEGKRNKYNSAATDGGVRCCNYP